MANEKEKNKKKPSLVSNLAAGGLTGGVAGATIGAHQAQLDPSVSKYKEKISELNNAIDTHLNKAEDAKYFLSKNSISAYDKNWYKEIGSNLKSEYDTLIQTPYASDILSPTRGVYVKPSDVEYAQDKLNDYKDNIIEASKKQFEVDDYQKLVDKGYEDYHADQLHKGAIGGLAGAAGGAAVGLGVYAAKKLLQKARAKKEAAKAEKKI